MRGEEGWLFRLAAEAALFRAGGEARRLGVAHQDATTVAMPPSTGPGRHRGPYNAASTPTLSLSLSLSFSLSLHSFFLTGRHDWNGLAPLLMRLF